MNGDFTVSLRRARPHMNVRVSVLSGFPDVISLRRARPCIKRADTGFERGFYDKPSQSKAALECAALLCAFHHSSSVFPKDGPASTKADLYAVFRNAANFCLSNINQCRITSGLFRHSQPKIIIFHPYESYRRILMGHSRRSRMPVVPTVLIWKGYSELGRLSEHALQFL